MVSKQKRLDISPFQEATEQELEQLGKMLKKNNVALGLFITATPHCDLPFSCLSLKSQYSTIMFKTCPVADIVSFGQVGDNSSLLKKLWTAVNANNSSHLLEIDEDGTNLSRAVMGSAMIAEGGAGAEMGGGRKPFTSAILTNCA